ncbi:MAG: single-stranded DNA-binding protein [Anaeroplasmataceae bacterium]|nr:single-stranded DNA-binding protein [Anaeroplasmataceae bacterium]
MYNYFMLMGRLVVDPEVKELSDGKKVMNVRLAVSRGFQNLKGEYETDFFTIVFWDYLVDYAKDNLKKGLPVLIKGRIQTTKAEMANGYNLTYPTLIGERIMFFNNTFVPQKEEEDKTEK